MGALGSKKVRETDYKLIKDLSTTYNIPTKQIKKITGRSHTTIDRIKKTKDYKEYQQLTKEMNNKPKLVVQDLPLIVEKPTTNTEVELINQTINELKAIRAHLCEQDKALADFKELYSWVAEHAIVDNRKKGWLR